MKIKLFCLSFVFFISNISFGSARYFAEIKPDNTVSRVIVADSQEWCYQNLGGNWVETYMNNPDKNYAGKGFDYLTIYNDFCSPRPYPSWILDEKKKWKAPKEMPVDGKRYEWKEDKTNWEIR